MEITNFKKLATEFTIFSPTTQNLLNVDHLFPFHWKLLLNYFSRPLHSAARDGSTIRCPATPLSVFIWCRTRAEPDGTRAETTFRLSPKRTSPFKSAGSSVQSTAGSRGVRISVSNAGYTTFRGRVRVLATHSIRQFPLHFPSPASPCATTFRTQYTSVFFSRDTIHRSVSTHFLARGRISWLVVVLLASKAVRVPGIKQRPTHVNRNALLFFLSQKWLIMRGISESWIRGMGRDVTVTCRDSVRCE